MNLKNIAGRYQRDIEEAVKYLKETGCTEVYLFGSVLGTAHRNSDIDLAVKGISPDRFFQIYGELMLRLSHPVDLIDLDLQQEFGRMLVDSGELIRVA